MGDNNVNLYLLESRLKNYFFNKDKKIVFLKADKDVSYGYVISVMDVIKRAGIETVGMIVTKKEKK
jgi:biopolymer transport protein TolR